MSTGSCLRCDREGLVVAVVCDVAVVEVAVFVPAVVLVPLLLLVSMSCLVSSVTILAIGGTFGYRLSAMACALVGVMGVAGNRLRVGAFKRECSATMASRAACVFGVRMVLFSSLLSDAMFVFNFNDPNGLFSLVMI